MSKIIKDKIKQVLVSEYSGLFTGNIINEEELKKVILRILDNIGRNERVVISEQDRNLVISELLNELVGFGPIDSLLKDPEITEIMINGPKKIYIEKKGNMELSSTIFEDEKQLTHLIHKIISPTRRRVDEFSPYVDVALPDGSRVNIVISPIALDGSALTIRKFMKSINTSDDLINRGTLDKRMNDFLIACVKSKVNIIFCGATGSGKTTTLSAFANYIGAKERIITIEDTAELHLPQENVVRLESRSATLEGKGEISIRDLFRNSLRMRPERIIVGEIRGGETLDMLQAICSGHTGSMAILHANSPLDAVYRMEMMILTSGLPISLEVIQRQIAAAINIIVQQEQMFDGSRKITHITQVNGLKDGQVVLEDLFRYEMEGITPEGKVQGKWKATGVTPVFYKLFEKSGVSLAKEIFTKD